MPQLRILDRSQPQSSKVVWIATFAFVFATGCAGIRHNQEKTDVLEARRLSQRGLDAIHDERYGEAETHFRDAVNRCPDDINSRYQLANCLWKRGDRQQAIAQLLEAIRADGEEDVDMLVELGYMYANVGELDNSFQIAERAIRAAPDSTAAWQLRGDVLNETNQFEAALASYQRALAYERDNRRILIACAEAYHQLDRPERVLSTLNHVDRLGPPGPKAEQSVVLKSIALRKLNRHQEAAMVLNRRHQIQPLSGDGLLELAECQLAIGQFAEAAQTVQAADQHLTHRSQQQRSKWLHARIASSSTEPPLR